jgi:glycosyltransferase involved in cell wall biosynthesis
MPQLTNEKILLYLGGSSFVKGFHIVLKAIDEVLKRHSDLRVIMARVKGGAVSTQNCVVYEEIPHEEVVKLHTITHALLFTSICEEPLPYAVIESMLMGTIPIATKVGGVPEIVKESPSEEYLFTPGNIDEFVDRIERLLTLSRDNIVDTEMKLKEHTLKLFNKNEVENRITSLFESIATQDNGKWYVN